MAKIRLAPDVARAVNHWGTLPKFDRWSRKNYGLTGRKLLARLTAGENAGQQEGRAPSSAGARKAFQFIPSTRDSFVSTWGIDPWRSADEGAHAAVIHLMGKDGKYGGGLSGYNPGGGQGYVDYILGQRVYGFRKQGGGRRSSSPGPAGSGALDSPGIGVGSSGPSLLELTKAIREQSRPQIQSVGLAPPRFSAQAAMPSGYQAPASGGVTPASTSLDDLLAQVGRTSGTGLPTLTSPGQTESVKAKSPASSGGISVRRDGWHGSHAVAGAAYEIAHDMGIGVSSEKRDTKSTATGGTSDHWVGSKFSWAADFDTTGLDSAQGVKLATRIARRYGVKFRMNSYDSGGTVKVEGRTYRLQILYGSGVDHADHVHVGVKRIL